MNNQRNNIIAIVLLLILLVTAGYFIFNSQTDWDYHLDTEKKSPYGTNLIYELIKEKNTKTGFTEIDHSVLESFRKLKKNKRYNYIFINNIPYYDSATIDTLWKFIDHGSTCFIACESLSKIFIDSVLSKEYHLNTSNNYYDQYTDYDEYTVDSAAAADSTTVVVNDTILKDTVAFTQSEQVDEHLNERYFKKITQLNFFNKKLADKDGYTYFKKYGTDTFPSYFAEFIPIADTDIIKPIDASNSVTFAGFAKTDSTPAVNFIILKHGKGQLIIMLTALPFTNYFTRTQKGLDFVEKVFAHLPNQHTLFDDVSDDYNYDDFDVDDMLRNHSPSEESPLYFILNNPSLRWAWYLLLTGIILYGIYRAKRRQKIIPVIEPKINTSLGYAETIGQLYFHEEEHIEIAIEMRAQFLNFLRNKYYLKTNELDESFMKQLSVKSGVELEKIQAVFIEFNDVAKIKSIDQKKLHRLNELLEYFYKTCK